MKILILIGTAFLISLSFLLYILSCYYIGVKGKSIFKQNNLKFKTKLYWLIFWIVALSYIFSLTGRKFLSVNNIFTSIFTFIGIIWLAIICYLLIIFPLVDLMKLIFRKTGYNGKIRDYLSRLYSNGIAVIIIVLFIISFGVWNAIHPIVTDYNININKNAGKMKNLNIVMIADIHMGISVRQNGIDKMVDNINNLNPDIVFFCGDLVDESTPTNLKVYMGNALKNIKSKYGVYAVTGNHEYLSSNLQETLYYLRKGNVKILQDEAVKINNSFYVIGRNDVSSPRITKQNVKPLYELLKNVDTSLPEIVLNHQPVNLTEPEQQLIDLQLSGHTHDGQFFPNNLITKLMYEDSYGYFKSGNFNLIVTSGYGTWGPPIRIGTSSEIVNIKLNFK
jgi:uncharacterized protein